MRDVAAWIRRMLVGGGAPMQALDDDRAAALLFVGSATEPGPGAAPLASELGFPRSPLLEDGIPVVDAETFGRITDPGIGWQK